MKMDRKYVNRRRWVAFIFVGIPLIAIGYYLINHVWWTDKGYCFGSMTKCLGL